jgi:hypothetical protein
LHAKLYAATRKSLWELHRVSRVHWEDMVSVSGDLTEQLAIVENLRQETGDQKEQIADLQERLTA